MTVKAFDGDPERLYAALDYAYRRGVAVTMARDYMAAPSAISGIDRLGAA